MRKIIEKDVNVRMEEGYFIVNGFHEYGIVVFDQLDNELIDSSICFANIEHEKAEKARLKRKWFSK